MKPQHDRIHGKQQFFSLTRKQNLFFRHLQWLFTTIFQSPAFTLLPCYTWPLEWQPRCINLRFKRRWTLGSRLRVSSRILLLCIWAKALMVTSEPRKFQICLSDLAIPPQLICRICLNGPKLHQGFLSCWSLPSQWHLSWFQTHPFPQATDWACFLFNHSTPTCSFSSFQPRPTHQWKWLMEH